MKGKLIGRGYTAEVYEWGEKEVIKLFYTSFPEVAIEREYHISNTIKELGLPAPAASDLIEIDGRKGIIYTRIIGTSMLGTIMKNPFKLKKYMVQMAEIHYNMHQIRGLDLPNYKESLEWNIVHAEVLTDEQKNTMIELLQKLPEGDALCHGDYHPGNIITNGTDTYILDWMTASSGVPAADVARTLLLLKDATLPEEIPGFVKRIIQIQRNNMAKKYWREYQKLSGLHIEDVSSWRTVLAAARLMESLPVIEKKLLLNIVNDAMAKA